MSKLSHGDERAMNELDRRRAIADGNEDLIRPQGRAAMTPAMQRALERALSRPRLNICPIINVHAGAQAALIAAMDRRGYIEWDGSAPRISGKAVAALKPTGGDDGR